MKTDQESLTKDVETNESEKNTYVWNEADKAYEAPGQRKIEMPFVPDLKIEFWEGSYGYEKVSFMLNGRHVASVVDSEVKTVTIGNKEIDMTNRYGEILEQDVPEEISNYVKRYDEIVCYFLERYIHRPTAILDKSILAISPPESYFRFPRAV